MAVIEFAGGQPLSSTLEQMRISEQHVSPDGQLTLQVAVADDSEIAVGFTGGEWHTHPDLLSNWLSVPEQQAVARFVELVKDDRLPIIMSNDGGQTIDPWVSDNLSETLQYSGKEKCILRYWSGKVVVL